MALTCMIRGGGDLASGVALRLRRSGIRVVVTELAQPLVVRRSVAFAEAVYTGQVQVEDVPARRVESPARALQLLQESTLPVLVDPDAACLSAIRPDILVDARMTKLPPDISKDVVPLFIGLGPGFLAPQNCHAVIETMRGHFLGRVYWQGSAQPDTGLPEAVQSRQGERVLRAPAAGLYHTYLHIGDHVEAGQVVAEVDGQPVRAAFSGTLRGLLHDGLAVEQGLKIGDLDPRNDPRLVNFASDKSLAIGGGVLEAILSRPELSARLCPSR